MRGTGPMVPSASGRERPGDTYRPGPPRLFFSRRRVTRLRGRASAPLCPFFGGGFFMPPASRAALSPALTSYKARYHASLPHPYPSPS